MLNQHDRRQLDLLERQLSVEDPVLAQAFHNWRPPSSKHRSQHKPLIRFPTAVSLRRWWGALLVVCGLGLLVLTVIGTTLGAWAHVAISLAALGGVFGLAALWFWVAYRNAVSDRRPRRR